MEWYKNSIPVKNVYYMLYYAFQAMDELKPHALKDLEKEKFEDVRDLLAAILGDGIAWQIRQGLYREYLDLKEDIPLLRGKLDITGTIRNEVAQRQLLSCEYDDLSENNPGNQILKTTSLLLLREKSVGLERKKVLRRDMLYFSNVNEVDPTNIQWSRLSFHRNNQLYRTLIYICQIVLEDMLLTTENGTHKLRSFIDERRMYWLYEKFILGYYNRELSSKLNAAASQVEWALGENDDTGKLPKMLSDITLSDKKNPNNVLIIDAKWYKKILQPKRTVKKGQNGDNEEDAGDAQVDADENYKENIGRVRSANLYQIFTYVKNKEATLPKDGNGEHKVSGMLLYARTYPKGKDGEIKKGTSGEDPSQKKFDPDEYKIAKYHIAGSEIHVRTLDLTEDFEILGKQLEQIAKDFFPEIF